jgi:signal transduction histidine kinase
MDVLIRDLLEYSRVSRTELDMVPVHVTEAAHEAEQNLSAAIKESGGRILIEAGGATVMASKTLLIQVLLNLLGNALKFVPKDRKPEVRLWTEEKGDSIRIHVSDNGIGIGPEYRHKIFQIFERLHSSSEYPGTGIGLAIVQKAVARMKGTLELESEVGKGSVFIIQLPKA